MFEQLYAAHRYPNLVASPAPVNGKQLHNQCSTFRHVTQGLDILMTVTDWGN